MSTPENRIPPEDDPVAAYLGKYGNTVQVRAARRAVSAADQLAREAAASPAAVAARTGSPAPGSPGAAPPRVLPAARAIRPAAVAHREALAAAERLAREAAVSPAAVAARTGSPTPGTPTPRPIQLPGVTVRVNEGPDAPLLTGSAADVAVRGDTGPQRRRLARPQPAEPGTSIVPQLAPSPEQNSAAFGAELRRRMDSRAGPLRDALRPPSQHPVEVFERIVTGQEAGGTWEPITVGDRFLNAGNRFASGVIDMPAGLLDAIAHGAKELDQLFQIEGWADKPLDEYATHRGAEWLRSFAERTFPGNPALQGEFLSDVLPNAFGQGVGFLAGGVAANAVGASAGVAVTASGVGMGAHGSYEDALAHGATEETARRASRLGALIGSTEALPIGRVLGRVDDVGGSLVRHVVQGAVEEGAQEGLSELATNVVAQRLYDSERPLMEGVLQATAAGAVPGATFSAGAHAIGRPHAPRSQEEAIGAAGLALTDDGVSFDPAGELATEDEAHHRFTADLPSPAPTPRAGGGVTHESSPQPGDPRHFASYQAGFNAGNQDFAPPVPTGMTGGLDPAVFAEGYGAGREHFATAEAARREAELRRAVVRRESTAEEPAAPASASSESAASAVPEAGPSESPEGGGAATGVPMVRTGLAAHVADPSLEAFTGDDVQHAEEVLAERDQRLETAAEESMAAAAEIRAREFEYEMEGHGDADGPVRRRVPRSRRAIHRRSRMRSSDSPADVPPTPLGETRRLWRAEGGSRDPESLRAQAQHQAVDEDALEALAESLRPGDSVVEHAHNGMPAITYTVDSGGDLIGLEGGDEVRVSRGDASSILRWSTVQRFVDPAQGDAFSQPTDPSPAVRSTSDTPSTPGTADAPPQSTSRRQLKRQSEGSATEPREAAVRSEEGDGAEAQWVRVEENVTAASFSDPAGRRRSGTAALMQARLSTVVSPEGLREARIEGKKKRFFVRNSDLPARLRVEQQPAVATPLSEPWRLSQRKYQERTARERRPADRIPVLNAADRATHEEAVRQALIAGEDVPSAALDAYPHLVLATHKDRGAGVEAIVSRTPAGFSVVVRDLDSLNTLPTAQVWPSFAQADARAREIVAGAPPVAASPAQAYGATNTVFTKTDADAARERLRRKLSGVQLNTGLDPELLMDGIMLGGFHAEAGVRRFAEWSAKMMEDVGEGIRPYLRSIYSAIRTWPGFDASGMDSDAEVESFERGGPSASVAENVDGTRPAAASSTGTSDATATAIERLAEATHAVASAVAQITTGGTDARTQPDDVGAAASEQPAPEPTGRIRADAGGRDAAGVPAERGRNRHAPVRGADRGSDAKGRAAAADVPGASDGAGRDLRAGSRDRDDGADPSAGRGDAEGDGRGWVQQHDPRLRNYRIGAADYLGAGGSVTKSRANLEAIRLLKHIESENRPATQAEQAILVRYSGWGGLKEMFTTRKNDTRLQAERALLAELLTEEEYASARASIKNAHYTSPEVVRAMWAAVRRLGFTGGRAVEPAMGVGHFLGLTPEEIATRIRWTGVELDSITGRIGRLLYPDANIYVRGFQDAPIGAGTADLAISNVPFGSYRVNDPAFKGDRAFLANTIHDYFFAKSLDVVRPGGLVAFVTSDGTLDKRATSVREYLASRADFLGAIRLPVDAFKANAGADVTTDIIFLRRREDGAESAHAGPFTRVVERQDRNGKQFLVNEWYAEHPEMMLGEMVVGDNRYGAGEEVHLVGAKGADVGGALARAIERLPEGVFRPAAGVEQVAAEPIPLRDEDSALSEGAFVERGGTILQRVGGALVDAGLGKGKRADQVRRFIRIRDAMRGVLRTQQEDRPDAEQDAARVVLNREYDAFVAKYGPINLTKEYTGNRTDKGTGEKVTFTYSRQVNLAPFLLDPDANLIASLEEYDPESGTASKMDVFTKRVIPKVGRVESVATPKAALPLSLGRVGRVDLPLIAQLSGTSEADAQRQLQVEGLIYRDPESSEWQTADEYLSGNVRRKLEVARAFARADEAFEQNVTALEANQPEDIPHSEIYAGIGAPWVPEEVYTEFARTLLRSQDVRVVWRAGTREYAVEAGKAVSRSVAALKEWGTDRISAVRLLEQALNQQSPNITKPNPVDPQRRVKDPEATVVAMAKQKEIKDRFEQWVWEDDARAEHLHRFYNDNFNNLRRRTFDGTHLTFEGASAVLKGRPFALRAHQRNAAWRIIQNRATLLAHVVGAGKTFTITGAVMEGRRMGIIRKPMIAVPNHMLRQWANEWLQMYPSARILVADDQQFDRTRRQRFTAKVATGDWDAVIMTHSAFELISISRERRAQALRAELAGLEEEIRRTKEEEGKDGANYVRELETQLENLRAKLSDLFAEEKKDDLLDFEALGVDFLAVDEAHLFKNLFTRTKIQGMAQAGSERAMDLYLKTQWLADQGGKVVLATGTPISNSMGEMYTMQRYLQPEVLREHGIETFDQWAASFGIVVGSVELDVTATRYKVKERFAEFVNVPELLQMWLQVADVQLAEDLNLPRPKVRGGEPKPIITPGSSELKEYLARLAERAAAVSAREVEPEVDNMLKIATDGRHAALDLRLVDPRASDHGLSKTSQAADRIVEHYRTFGEHRGVQLVFLDISTPSAAGRESRTGGLDGFSAYYDLREKLIARGIPPTEIAFVQDAAGNDKKKAQLFADVRAGKIRVLMGSTETMGAGTNVQDRLVALHHLDVPWVPANLEQREGRILRQGNVLWELGVLGNPSGGADDVGVYIYRYAAQDSFDTFMWQTVERKARFISQIMKGDLSVRRMEDIDAVVIDAANMKAISSGNPLLMEEIGLSQKVDGLERARRAHVEQQREVRRSLTMSRDAIPGMEASVEKAKEEAARIESTKGDAFKVKLGDKVYTKRQDAGEAISKRLVSLATRYTEERKQTGGSVTLQEEIGEFAGAFPLLLYVSTAKLSNAPAFSLMLRGADNSYFSGISIEASAQSIIQTLEALPAQIAGQVERRSESLARERERMADLERVVGQPFKQQEELDRLAAKLREVRSELGMGAGASSPAEVPAVESFADDDGIVYMHAGLGLVPPEAWTRRKFSPLATSQWSEVERRVEAARGIASPTLLQQLREGAREMAAGFGRHFRHLNPDSSPATALTIDVLRQYESSTAWAKAVAADQLARITEGLSPPQIDLLGRILQNRDILRDVDEGRYEGKDELPFGYVTARQVEEDLATYESKADDRVRAALRRRAEFTRQVTERLVELELLPAKVLEDGRYYHRQVMAYVNRQDFTPVGTGSQDVRLKEKGFQKGRSGGGDFNTHYAEAEFEWLAQALSLIARQETLNRVRQINDLSRELKARARMENENLVRALALNGQQAQARRDGVAWSDEMFDDPLLPFRQKIARGISGLVRMARAGELRSLGDSYADVIRELTRNPRGDHSANPRWFGLLSHLLDNDLPGAMHAGAIFRAIHDRDAYVRETLGDDLVRWEDLVPRETHTIWQPERGHHFYSALTASEEAIEQAIADGRVMQRDEFREAMVVGAPKEQWVIPKELAATLDNFNPRYDQSPFEQASGWWLSTWKQWRLLNPRTVLRYNLNNTSGDLDIILAADPGILRHVPQAARDLAAYFHAGTAREEVQGEIRNAMRRGVLDSGLSIQEIPDINQVGAFRALARSRSNVVREAAMAYWSRAKGYTTFRENLLRLAAFRYYREQVNAGRVLYRASRRSEVDAIRDPQDRAAKLARELVGDYGNISANGQWIRRHMIPFYSWMEINLPRYVRLLRNAAHDGGSPGRLAGVLGGRAAVTTATTVLKMNILFAAVNVWNYLFFRDEEEELRGEGGRDLHLILGRAADGEIRTLRIEGALSDALRWFALSDYPRDAADLLSGESSLLDKAAEAVKSPINRLVNAWEPMTKTMFETALGRSAYPSLFEDGTSFRIRGRVVRDRAQHVAQAVALDNLYRRVTDKPARKIDGPLGEVESMLFYRTDPGEAAYWETRGMTTDWLEEQGKESPSIMPTRKANTLYYYKQALRWGEPERAERWLQRYFKLGGTERGLEQSLRRSAPLGAIAKKDRDAFRASLTGEERRVLQLAEGWYSRTMLGPGGGDSEDGGGERRPGRAIHRPPAAPRTAERRTIPRKTHQR